MGRVRREAIAAGTHLAVDLSQDDVRADVFVWDGLPFSLEQVAVSALHYNPALAALVAGYNFGCWRLVHLPTLEVDYSSSYTNQEPGVTHIAFQVGP